MKKLTCLLIIMVLTLTGCEAASLTLSDPALDTAVKEMFIAMADGDEGAQSALRRSDFVVQEGVTVGGTYKSEQPLSRNVEITDGVTQKDARYQVETKEGNTYIILVRYIIDENEAGFYQYTVAQK